MDTTEEEETKNCFCFCNHNQATVPYLGFILYISTGYLVITLQSSKNPIHTNYLLYQSFTNVGTYLYILFSRSGHAVIIIRNILPTKCL